jgi:hypothetical protein
MYFDRLSHEILEVLVSGCAGTVIVAGILAGCWAIGKVVDRD